METEKKQGPERAEKKPRKRPRLALPKHQFRTAVGNGSRVLDSVDGRSHIARRHVEITAQIAEDLGGINRLSEAQLQLIRSAAGLVVLREGLDAKASNGEPIDVSTYCRISNSLRRVLSTIGLTRVPKDVTPPDPLTYAREYDRRKAEEAEEVQA